jgi:GNAT superfamily N-acetyltransferase
MLRIRRIYDDVLPINKEALQQVQEILRTRFSAVDDPDIDDLSGKRGNPLTQRFRTILFVAENLPGKIQGVASLLHEPEIGFAFLDWIAITSDKAGGGIGKTLYEQVRMEASGLKANGLFVECLPDEMNGCPDKALIKENRDRLRFYEQYGARPIVNTNYGGSVQSENTCLPCLIYDGLDDVQKPLSRSFARKVVRAILERKYGELCSTEYVDAVVASFKDDPVKLRELKYVNPEEVHAAVESRSYEQIALIVNERHTFHPVHEPGYVEPPMQVRSIPAELETSDVGVPIRPRPFPDIHGVKYGYEVQTGDAEKIRHLAEVTGFFSDDEVAVAGELVDERLAKGPESGYFFVMAEQCGRLIGYACYGPIPCTTSSFDLYWIVVHPDFQGRGLGRALLKEAERLIKSAGGGRIYVDTSQRDQYASTRAFYESCGYRLETVLADFYAPGDGKVIYCKALIGVGHDRGPDY